MASPNSLLPQGPAPNRSHSGGTPEENPGQCPAHEVPGQTWSPRGVGSTSPPILTCTSSPGPTALEQQEFPCWGHRSPSFGGRVRWGPKRPPSLHPIGLHFEPVGVGSWQFGETAFGDSAIWECRNNVPRGWVCPQVGVTRGKGSTHNLPTPRGGCVQSLQLPFDPQLGSRCPSSP